MFDALTDRQRQVLEAIRAHTAEQGYPPTVREIGKTLGLASASTVHAHLAALERHGHIQRDPSKPRALLVNDIPTRSADGSIAAEVEIESTVLAPLVGQVAAGEPLLAEENFERYVPVPSMLARRDESFVLKVRGESMILAGILDGDYVVVRRASTGTPSDIVVAMVEGEATCKRLVRRDGVLRLLAENPDMGLVDADHFEVIGVVTGVFRAV